MGGGVTGVSTFSGEDSIVDMASMRWSSILGFVKGLLFFLAITTSAVSQRTAAHLPVFPGAEGWGSNTPAGRGGKILRVTNLDDGGPGSLRAAVDAAGARIIVFEVGGTIRLGADLNIKHPYVTVAGQSAPPPGITLRGAGVRVSTHDVLIQHLRIRVGDDPVGPAPANRDALQILGPGARNVVIDHLSASWALDENVSTWYPLSDVTIQHSIISEGLAGNPLNRAGQGGKGLLVGDASQRVALIGNLFAHNIERNPRIKGNTSVLVINNLFYDAAKYSFMSIGSPTGPVLISIVGNIFFSGPSTADSTKAIKVESNASDGTTVFLGDNRFDNKPLVIKQARHFVLDSPPIWCEPLSVLPSSEVEEWVLSHAGARPVDPDEVDNRIKADVRSGRGRIIVSQKDIGGWPNLKASFRSFVIPSNPDGDDDGDGYTNIEETLHRMATEIENTH